MRNTARFVALLTAICGLSLFGTGCESMQKTCDETCCGSEECCTTEEECCGECGGEAAHEHGDDTHVHEGEASDG